VGILSNLFPGFAARRLVAKARLEAAKRYYDAAQTSNYRPRRGSGASGDAVMQATGAKLRELARHLYENHDLAVGIVEDLVNNAVGRGITIEPMMTQANGELAVRANDQAKRLWKQWWQQPEVTGELPGGEVERMVLRRMLVDGEVLIQHVTQPSFRYPSKLRYVLELIEADYLPFEMIDSVANVRHGVEKDQWGRPIAFHLYFNHPGDTLYVAMQRERTKRVPAEAISHVKFTRRLKQTRGVTVLAPALTRLDDIYDYEASERIAARIAADITMFIRKSPDFIASTETNERTFQMEKGMIFDGLLPGEDIGMIKSERPNEGLANFRAAMLKAAAAGTGTRYSSIARSYDGTYSAQRQELVEARTGYEAVLDYLVGAFYRPVWRNFVTNASLQGLIDTRGVDPESLLSADFRGPTMPWIDPLKEVQAQQLRIQARLTSRHAVMRASGEDPAAIDKQIENDPYQEEYGSAMPNQTEKGQQGGGQAQEEMTEEKAA
jgi:lambda family phage portal protein